MARMTRWLCVTTFTVKAFFRTGIISNNINCNIYLQFVNISMSFCKQKYSVHNIVEYVRTLPQGKFSAITLKQELVQDLDNINE